MGIAGRNLRLGPAPHIYQIIHNADRRLTLKYAKLAGLSVAPASQLRNYATAAAT